MEALKVLKTNDKVTYSNDRSSSIDGNATLLKRRKDLERKWKDFNELICEVWEGLDKEGEKCLFERNLYDKDSKSEFTLTPDFNNDLS